MKGVAVAAWAAIGAAAMKFAKDVVMSTNRTGDAWEMFIAKSKAGWSSFLQTLSSWNWDNWIGRIKEATRAAENLQSALDASFEIKNSIELQKSAMAEELANLQILMRDVSKPYEIRAKAAQDYLDKVKPIYQQEIDLANKLLDAQQGKWLAGTGLTDSEQTRADLMRFLVDIGKDANLYNNLAQYVAAQDIIDKQSGKSIKNYGKLNQAYSDRAIAAGNIAGARSQYETDIVALFRAYEQMRGDADTAPLIQAAINADYSRAAFNEETREVRQVSNQAEAAAIKDAQDFSNRLAADLDEGLEAAFAEIDAFDDSFADLELEIPEIDTKNLDKALEEIKQNAERYREELAIVEQSASMFKDALQSAMGDGLQAITDMMFGLENADLSNVAAALLMPFGNMAKQMGALIMSYGLSMDAFKKAFVVPEAAIAAGAGLMAIGAAITSGARKISEGNLSAGGGTGTSYGGSSVGANVQNYESTLTVEVVGKISGNDINISGKKAAYAKNR
jgi:hypothetical protein